MSQEILVLNNSYMPIAKTNPERAICLLLLGKAFSIKNSGKVMKSPTVEVEVPEILVLKDVNYIKRHFTSYTKKAVLRRDNYTCQMCGETKRDLLTLEHLIPKSRWEKISKERCLTYSRDSFENTCILCKFCNHRVKSNSLPEEIGWEFVARSPLTDFDINWDEIFS